MITIVSGLPRSGTSMMMKMLEAGGMPCLFDVDNPSTELNPGGAYAYAPTKTLGNDATWLKDAEGKAVKIVSMFLTHLPKEYHYKILFMERDIKETHISTRKMIAGIGKYNPDVIGDENMMLQQREAVKQWLSCQDNIEVLLVDYNKLIESKNHKEIADFLGVKLNTQKMATIPDKQFYRNRRA